MLNLILIIILSYLVGSIPTSIILGKALRGIDIREYGSRNPGTTNVFRVMGWRPALLVLAIDVGKGVFATLVISKISFSAVSLEHSAVQLCAGMSAVVGHIWTIFAGFRGGKGVGTALGVVIGLAPLASLVCFLIWAVVVITTRYVSVSSIIGAISLPIVLHLSKVLYHHEISQVVFIFSYVIAVLIVFTHRSNIKRLLRGEENRFNKLSLTKRG